jgi:outer membrane protein assembly factor BamA
MRPLRLSPHAWAVAVVLAAAAPVQAAPLPEEATTVVRYRLEPDAACDTLLARLSGSPAARTLARAREELADLCDRIRAERAAAGGAAECIRLTLLPPAGPGAAGLARIQLVGGTGGSRRERLGARVAGAPLDPSFAAQVFLRAAGAAPTPASIQAGLRALLAEVVRRGHADAEAHLDSLVPTTTETRAYITVHPGPIVRVEALDLEGGAATRATAAQAIAGLPRGAVVTPSALDAARERLVESGLFASVGAPRVTPGSAPDRARIAIPVEEVRASRFEGAVGLQQGAGATGLLDLALGNIAGTGRSAGARWRGFGGGRSEYAARFREPALLGRPLEASASLEGSLSESLYTETRWALRLGSRVAPGARASLGVARSGAVYTGLARGSSGTWTVTCAASWDGLSPAGNPTRGASAQLSLDAGRRRESTPGLPDLTRGLLRASLQLQGAAGLGSSRALFASVRTEAVTVGRGEGFPAEELRYLGGSEGLRGHGDRAYGGDRLLAASLEHRWLGGGESRSYLFIDAGYHSLGGPLAAGGGPVLPAGSPARALPASLARTELSRGWEFGYGAGLRTRMAAGSVGLELGLAPGTPVREAKLHLHYASRW